MKLNKDQQDNLEFLCDREATICAIVEILLDHKLATVEEFLKLKQTHFDKLKPAVDEAVEHFAEPQKPAQLEGTSDRQPDNENAIINCNVKIGLSANSYDEARQMIDKLKAACTGNYTFNVDFNGAFTQGINIGGLSTFHWNFQFPTMV